MTAANTLHLAQLNKLWQEQREYAGLLRQCGKCNNIREGRKIHVAISCSEQHRHDRVLLNLLVEMYGKCSSLLEARRVFESIYDPNVFSWTILMSAYAHNGDYTIALRCFRHMICGGVHPSEATVVCVLGIYAKLGKSFLAEGKAFHSLIVSQTSSSSIIVETALVGMYSGLGSLQDAAFVFQNIQTKGLVSWNVMIAAYAQNGHPLKAIETFREMLLEGSCLPDHVTFVTVLDACSKLGSLPLGGSIHEIVNLAFDNPHLVVKTALVNMYGNCGGIIFAEEVFREMKEKDVVAWTSMMVAFAQNGQMLKALTLYEEMKSDGVEPSEMTLKTAMWACTGLEDVSLVHTVLSDSRNVLNTSTAFENNLLETLGSCGFFEEALCRFYSMRKKDETSWSVIIAACVKVGNKKMAFSMFYHMQLEGFRPDGLTFLNLFTACNNEKTLTFGKKFHKIAQGEGFVASNTAVGNAIINMYGRCGCVEDANLAFKSMPLKDVVSWNIIVAAGDPKEAFKQFCKMDLEGIKPNNVTFINILAACSRIRRLSWGQAIHKRVIFLGCKTTEVENALVNMYAKCGDFEAAKNLFDASPSNVISWTVMISAYADHGLHSQALQLFVNKPEDMEPTLVTYVTVLGICSVTGCLTKGRAIHERILKNTMLESNAFIGNALVNMYGKCGDLETAVECFNKMEAKDFISWNALLAAYTHNGRGKEALLFLGQMNLEGFVPNNVTFVSVMFACSHVGQISVACDYFLLMQQEFSINPVVEHYACMIDILGRAGWVEMAEDLVKAMPFYPSGVSWMSLFRNIGLEKRLLVDLNSVK